MECPRQNRGGEELMVAYTAGTLEPSAQIEFERHMAVCEACRQSAAEQKAVWEALDGWKPAAISPDFNAKLYARISEDVGLPWWERALRVNWSRALRPAMPVAAACAAIVIAFLIKEPSLARRTSVTVEQKVSIEQVERALDDMDMLKQMSLTTPVEGQSSEPI